MLVVAQISDLHLSQKTPARQTQAERVLAGVNAASPDLVVITGDLTDDGWERPEDLVWAKQWMDERLDGEWFAVPGNHDVGNFAGAEHGAISAERMRQWANVFMWKLVSFCVTPPSIRRRSWMILGLNSMLFGSGLTCEPEQCDWLTKKLAEAKRHGLTVAVMTHSPLYIDIPGEEASPAADYWLGGAKPRQALLAQLADADVGLIASGHVHQSRQGAPGQPHHVWAPPASGTWVHAPGLPNPPAPERTGFVLHHLGDDGSVRSEVVACAPMLKTVFYDPTASG